MEKENSKYREQIEQERRDHELALRLAQETHSQVEDISTPVRRQVTTLKLFSLLSLFYVYTICFVICILGGISNISLFTLHLQLGTVKSNTGNIFTNSQL